MAHTRTPARRFPPMLAALVLAVVLGGCSTLGDSIDECLPVYLEGVSDQRVTTAEAGTRDLVVLESDQSKSETFALIVTRDREPVLALRVNYFEDGEIFKIESMINDSCRILRTWEVDGRPDEQTLQNWDTAIVRTAGAAYRIRLGYPGSGRIEADVMSE